jgi:hypothetical protein
VVGTRLHAVHEVLVHATHLVFASPMLAGILHRVQEKEEQDGVVLRTAVGTHQHLELPEVAVRMVMTALLD